MKTLDRSTEQYIYLFQYWSMLPESMRESFINFGRHLIEFIEKSRTEDRAPRVLH